MPFRPMPVLLKNLTADQLHAQLAHVGVKPRLARIVQAAALRRGEFPAPTPGVSPRVLAEVQRLAAIPHLALLDRRVSPQDGFTKYLFRGEGPEPFETVRIPLLHRPNDPKFVVCVSSQVGCAMGCRFCATGRMGFCRNLAALGNRRPGRQGPGRFAAPRARRGLHGHGRAAAQLRRRHPGRPHPLRTLRPGHRRQGDHHLDRRASCPPSAASRPSGIVPARRVAQFRRPRLPRPLDACGKDPLHRRTLGRPPRVPCRHRPSRDPRLDHDRRRQHPRRRCAATRRTRRAACRSCST